MFLYFASYIDFVFVFVLFFLLLFYRNCHETAPVSSEVVPMEYSTSVNEASTIVTVAKTVIIIYHLVARAKSGSVRNSKIHCATEQ